LEALEFSSNDRIKLNSENSDEVLPKWVEDIAETPKELLLLLSVEEKKVLKKIDKFEKSIFHLRRRLNKVRERKKSIPSNEVL